MSQLTANSTLAENYVSVMRALVPGAKPSDIRVRYREIKKNDFCYWEHASDVAERISKSRIDIPGFFKENGKLSHLRAADLDAGTKHVLEDIIRNGTNYTVEKFRKEYEKQMRQEFQDPNPGIYT